MSKNLNEPAFPVTSCRDHEFVGLTLRDYFAAKAMQATLSNESANERLKWICEKEGNDPFELAAHGAYLMADAMLAARVKP